MKKYNFFKFVNKLMRKKPINFIQKSASPATNPRIPASWRNSKGFDCKIISPDSKCLCDHRYKDHNNSDFSTFHVHCNQKKCSCPQFFYLPSFISHDLSCFCDHSYKFHDPISHKCTKGNCGGCDKKGFNSAYICQCGERFNQHSTIFEGKLISNAIEFEGEFPEKYEGNYEDSVDIEDYERNIRKNGKLKDFNDKLLLEQRINNEEIADELYRERLMKKIGSFNEEMPEVSALSLYRTPHSYIRYNFKI